MPITVVSETIDHQELFSRLISVHSRCSHNLLLARRPSRSWPFSSIFIGKSLFSLRRVTFRKSILFLRAKYFSFGISSFSSTLWLRHILQSQNISSDTKGCHRSTRNSWENLYFSLTVPRNHNWPFAFFSYGSYLHSGNMRTEDWEKATAGLTPIRTTFSFPETFLLHKIICLYQNMRWSQVHLLSKLPPFKQFTDTDMLKANDFSLSRKRPVRAASK